MGALTTGDALAAGEMCADGCCGVEGPKVRLLSGPAALCRAPCAPEMRQRRTIDTDQRQMWWHQADMHDGNGGAVAGTFPTGFADLADIFQLASPPATSASAHELRSFPLQLSRNKFVGRERVSSFNVRPSQSRIADRNAWINRPSPSHSILRLIAAPVRPAA